VARPGDGGVGRWRAQRVFIRTFSVRGKIGGDGSVLGKVRVGEFLRGRNSDSERDAPGTACGEKPQPL